MKAVVRSFSVALFALGMTLPAVSQDLDEGGDSIKNCYHIRGEARYGALAYKHVVVVTNKCEVSLQCEVWTDVDPSPKHAITVAPNSSEEVIVRNNSPARGFRAFGECKK